jgi:hypothetical protein
MMTYVPMKEPDDSRDSRIEVQWTNGTPVPTGAVFRDTKFRDHNCSRCRSGERACVKGDPRRCDWPHARND